MGDCTDYRLAFILPQSRQLLGMQSTGACELPLISIPLWERPAEHLTRLIEKTWNIKTLVLDVLSDESLPSPCAVVEVRSPLWHFEREGFATVALDNISTLSLGDGMRSSLQSILAGGDAGRGPFSRIGWIEEAQAWIQDTITDREVSFTGDMRHLNACGQFCLLRLGTASGPAYWLKAVGQPNAHEFGITNYLSKHCPQYLPRIVAVREDWNAWVMEEVGSSLRTSTSLEDFKLAVQRLAHLQKELSGRSEELLAIHCGDHRTETLRTHIDEMIAYLGEAMRLQTSTKAPTLSSATLKQLGVQLHQACSALLGLGIPDSLMHNDISPGSILSDGADCVFTDWCEGYVGNPFITFEQLCVHVGHKAQGSESWVRGLRSVYRSCWTDVLTEHQIGSALQLAPLISVFSYLCGRGDWLQSSRRHEPAFQSYSRSLARHMERIATNVDLTEALCQQN